MVNDPPVECAITCCVPQEPVTLTCCGNTFEQKPLLEWKAKSNQCPICRESLPAKLSVSIALKNIIKAWYELPHQVKAPDSSSLSLKNALAQSSTSSSQVKSVYDNRVNWKAAVSATRNSIKKPMEVIDMTGDDTPTVSSSS